MEENKQSSWLDWRLCCCGCLALAALLVGATFFGIFKYKYQGESPSYSSESAGGSYTGSGQPCGSEQEMAKKILEYHKKGLIILSSSDGEDGESSPYQNIKDTAEGKTPVTSKRAHGGRKPVAISPHVLSKMIQAAESGQKMRVNYILGAKHTYETSLHYVGKSIDLYPLGNYSELKDIFQAEESIDEAQGTPNHHYHFGWSSAPVGGLDQGIPCGD